MNKIPSGFALERLVKENVSPGKKDNTRIGTRNIQNQQTINNKNVTNTKNESSGSAEIFEKIDNNIDNKGEKNQKDINKKISSMKKSFYKVVFPNKEKFHPSHSGKREEPENIHQNFSQTKKSIHNSNNKKTAINKKNTKKINPHLELEIKENLKKRSEKNKSSKPLNNTLDNLLNTEKKKVVEKKKEEVSKKVNKNIKHMEDNVKSEEKKIIKIVDKTLKGKENIAGKRLDNYEKRLELITRNNLMEESLHKLTDHMDTLQERHYILSGNIEAIKNIKCKAEVELDYAYGMRSTALNKRNTAENRIKKILENRKKRITLSKARIKNLKEKEAEYNVKRQNLSGSAEEMIKSGKTNEGNFEYLKERGRNFLSKASNYETIARWKLNKIEDLLKTGGSKNLSIAKSLKEEIQLLMPYITSNRKEGNKYIDKSKLYHDGTRQNFKKGKEYIKEGNKYTDKTKDIHKILNQVYNTNTQDTEKNREDIKYNNEELSFSEYLAKNSYYHIDFAMKSNTEKKHLKSSIKKDLSGYSNTIHENLFKINSEKWNLRNSIFTFKEGKIFLNRAYEKQNEDLQKKNNVFSITQNLKHMNKKQFKESIDKRREQSIFIINENDSEELIGSIIPQDIKEKLQNKTFSKKEPLDETIRYMLNTKNFDITSAEANLKNLKFQTDRNSYKLNDKKIQGEELSRKFSTIDMDEKTYELSRDNYYNIRNIDISSVKEIDGKSTDKKDIKITDIDRILRELTTTSQKDKIQQLKLNENMTSLETVDKKSKEKLLELNEARKKSTEIVFQKTDIDNAKKALKDKKEIEHKDKPIFNEHLKKVKENSINNGDKKEVKAFIKDLKNMTRKMYEGFSKTATLKKEKFSKEYFNAIGGE
ncbi:MAG: hypothetical protein BWY64_00991 [bacterium ADurb.Bin363]|nr:MAG: hypothetical protein BWY64_00991 [bacterium ADurb.Bin363]